MNEHRHCLTRTVCGLGGAEGWSKALDIDSMALRCFAFR